MSSSRRRGGRGSDFVRSEQNWRSPRSGSPGSPGINGSPRTGRRERREPTQPSTDHDIYVDFLNKKCIPLFGFNNHGNITFYKDTEFHSGEPEYPMFDIEGFFAERQQQLKQGQQATHSQIPPQNVTGLPS